MIPGLSRRLLKLAERGGPHDHCTRAPLARRSE
jgi:hypothetical protein